MPGTATDKSPEEPTGYWWEGMWKQMHTVPYWKMVLAWGLPPDFVLGGHLFAQWPFCATCSLASTSIHLIPTCQPSFLSKRLPFGNSSLLPHVCLNLLPTVPSEPPTRVYCYTPSSRGIYTNLSPTGWSGLSIKRPEFSSQAHHISAV